MTHTALSAPAPVDAPEAERSPAAGLPTRAATRRGARRDARRPAIHLEETHLTNLPVTHAEHHTQLRSVHPAIGAAFATVQRHERCTVNGAL